ncbi:response regulator [Crocosphaera sp.]|uniref:response regulator n=1 Tax=Crocosphaera sp. TaxID=2729996 RepID=UPI003F28B278|nr:response regulator [Crocosphaera sp.]
MAYVNQETIKTSSPLTTLSMTQGISSPSPVCFQNFATTQQATLFQELKNNQFSGRITCRTSQGQDSHIYWYLGRIIYVTGGTHYIRRWRRTVLQNCPQIKAVGFQSINIQKDIAASLGQNHPISWDYDLLCCWFKQQKITRNQLLEVITSMVIEVLFDLMQSRKVTCYFYPDNRFASPPLLFDPQQIIVATWKPWQNWHRSTLGNHSPNEAPVIKSLEQLKKRTSAKTYDVLAQYADGKRSLRDLSVYINQDLLRLTSSLMLYIQLGLIDLAEIPDLPQPSALPKKKSQIPEQKKLIACVNDNPRICQLINDIVNEKGYNFLGINDSSKVMSLCVLHKPDLIFVDLEMPGINSGQICRQLRNQKALQSAPILALVEKEGIFERWQNKILGCSGFVRKPINRQEILETILQHLPQAVAA